MSTEQHETVGHYFRFSGDVYLCTRYDKRQGFWMKMIELNRSNGPQLIPRQVGDETCVSERAIGRTYHRIYDPFWVDKYEAHQQPCECYVCQPR